ncbi:hypothetical protein [Ruegeria sp.]|uniref:hypothetical protein n=1 Tax=Ruegeria sp. TaxID=1879320 RepID=UPI003B5A433C
MHPALRKLALSAVVAFVVLTVLSVTPLAAIPTLLNPATFGWAGLALFLLIIGAPFGGLAFILIFSPSEKRAGAVAGLCGAWIGAIVGSIFGIQVLGSV